MEKNKFSLPDQKEDIEGDEEFKKFAQQQREVDESRRKEIESELRAIWGGEFTGAGYSPSEGFMFCADFLMTRHTRFEDLHLRYSV